MVAQETYLSIMPQIFYNIALFSTILFVIKLILFTIFGGDSEVSGDFTTETDTDTSFSFISIQSLLAFLMGFGWMGYAGLVQFGWSNLVSVFSAVGVGVLFMFVSTFLMFSVKKLEKNVKKDINTAVGKIGKAYTNFDEKGYGKIEIEISGQLCIVDAYNMTDTPINAFDMAEVVGVKDKLLQVVKVTE